MTDDQSHVGRLMGLLGSRDRDGALTLVRERRSAGEATSAIITELLAPAQRQVGVLWQSRSWNVAQEHVATAIVDAALAELELGADVVPTRGGVVVCCAEGEWHALPARMFAEQLRGRGWEVTFLGASTPAEDLARFLPQTEVVAVAVSCSIPTYLVGAERTITAVHESGFPVVAGGEAFGSTARRAERVGADGWAMTAAEADRLLSTWADCPPALRSSSSDRAALRLAAVREDLLDSLELVAPSLRPARSESRTLLEFLEAAVLTGDPEVLAEALPWLDAVGDVPDRLPQSTRAAVDQLDIVLLAEHPQARQVLMAARSRWLGGPGPT